MTTHRPPTVGAQTPTRWGGITRARADDAKNKIKKTIVYVSFSLFLFHFLLSSPHPLSPSPSRPSWPTLKPSARTLHRAAPDRSRPGRPGFRQQYGLTRRHVRPSVQQVHWGVRHSGSPRLSRDTRAGSVALRSVLPARLSQPATAVGSICTPVCSRTPSYREAKPFRE